MNCGTVGVPEFHLDNLSVDSCCKSTSKGMHIFLSHDLKTHIRGTKSWNERQAERLLQLAEIALCFTKSPRFKKKLGFHPSWIPRSSWVFFGTFRLPASQGRLSEMAGLTCFSIFPISFMIDTFHASSEKTPFSRAGRIRGSMRHRGLQNVCRGKGWAFVDAPLSPSRSRCDECHNRRMKKRGWW